MMPEKKNLFVGRGEQRVADILKHLYHDAFIAQQVPSSRLLDTKAQVQMGEEYWKHKYDIALWDTYTETSLVIEVNWKHTPKSNKKWKVLKAYLEELGHIPVTIEPENCQSLFTLEDETNINTHVNTWQDWIDVIGELERQGVKPQ